MAIDPRHCGFQGIAVAESDALPATSIGSADLARDAHNRRILFGGMGAGVRQDLTPGLSGTLIRAAEWTPADATGTFGNASNDEGRAAIAGMQ